MERQQEAFQQRYAKKMAKILTKLSKETEKARVAAASQNSAAYKVVPSKHTRVNSFDK